MQMNPLTSIKLILYRYFSPRNTMMIKLNQNTIYHFNKFYREGENS